MKIQSLAVADPQAVADFEKRLGFALPTDYKSFLSRSNGARVIDGYFFVEGLRQQIMMHILFGLNSESRALNLEFWLKELDGEIPEKSLLIGNDKGGGFILLINDGVDDGVYYYDDKYFFEESSDELNTFPIADSFDAFLEMLENERLSE